MKSLSLHPYRDDILAARAAAEAAPSPAPSTPLPPGWGRAMLDYLNTEAPVLDLRAADGKLGMRRQAAPKPRPANPFGPNRYAPLEYTAFVSMRIVANEYDAVADELEAALAELAALALLTAKAVAP